MKALHGVRVLDLSDNLSGAYCTKLLADVGAVVIAADGPLEGRAPGHHSFGVDPDSLLGRHLRTAHLRVRGADARTAALGSLAAEADIIVESGALDAKTVEHLRSQTPSLVVTSVRPFGFEGPWVDRPATEFTVQALCGSSIFRGFADRDPLWAAGRIGEWLAGAYAAVATLGAHYGIGQGASGEHIDVGLAEAEYICFTLFQNVQKAMGGPEPRRGVSIPSIEPTADGWVGFSVNTPDHFRAYTAMLGHPELADLPGIMVPQQREQYRAQLDAAAHSWLATRTTDEVIRIASTERIPVAPVNDVGTLLDTGHFLERKLFEPGPDAHLVPRRPFLVDGKSLDPDEGAVLNQVPTWPARNPEATPPVKEQLPLAGIRIVDMTAWWAGPCSTQILAALGAEVIKVESHTRYDGMRDVTARPRTTPEWWEWSWQFQAVNTDKAGIAVDLTRPEGRAILDRLLEDADLLVENGSPGVLPKLGLSWDELHARFPRLTVVRMPAFGLDGPWSEMRGFDPTAAQASGLASLTGYVGDRPIGPRGFCDDVAGVHSAFITLAALHEARFDGIGHHVESAMGDVVVSLLAEHLLSYQASGKVPERSGNRGPLAAPQGIYSCAGEEEWLAVAVTSDDQWSALRSALGDPGWAGAASLASAEGRRAKHDLLDRQLARACAGQDAAELADRLRKVGVPAERLQTPTEAFDAAHFRERAFSEKVDHAVVGTHEYPSLPFRFRSRAHEPWFRNPSPRLGEHNLQVLTTVAGLTADEVAQLEADGVIGNRPA